MPKKYKLPAKKRPSFAAQSYPVMLEIDALCLDAAGFKAFVEDLCTDLAVLALQYNRQKQNGTQVKQVRISHGKSIEARALIFGPA